MKSVFYYPAFVAVFLSFNTVAFAQDLPVPAPDTALENAQVADNNASVQASSATTDETQSLIAFFKGLDEAVTAHSGNCQAMSDEITSYYNRHKKWIDSLDYATQNIPQAEIDEIHQLAVDFGKKLAVCHDQKSIPDILKKYAGMSGEF